MKNTTKKKLLTGLLYTIIAIVVAVVIRTVAKALSDKAAAAHRSAQSDTGALGVGAVAAATSATLKSRSGVTPRDPLTSTKKSGKAAAKTRSPLGAGQPSSSGGRLKKPERLSNGGGVKDTQRLSNGGGEGGDSKRSFSQIADEVAAATPSNK